MKSPNHPLNYPVDQHVTYPLMVAEGKAIELTFTSMDIEECTDPDFGGKCYLLLEGFIREEAMEDLESSSQLVMKFF